MKLQKIILCVMAALTAFGASVGLIELGRYFAEGFQPANFKFESPELIQPPVYAPSRSITKGPVFLWSKPEPVERDEESCDWGETGDYRIIGTSPKGFENFDYLSVVTKEYSEEGDDLVAVKPYGAVNTEKEFKFSRINIADKRMSFVTATRKGVSYQFDGKFVHEELKAKDENGEEYTEDVFLKGRLTKWLNGVKVADAKVKFTEMCGC